MTFKETLEIHLSSLKNKNIKMFTQTISSENRVTLIMPDGTFINDRDEFADFHKQWFSDPDWDMEYNIIKTEEGADMAYALILVEYFDKDPEGKEYDMKYYLNLIFKLQNNKWLLVHDQNTLHAENKTNN